MASSNDTLVDDSEAQSVNGADSSATESNAAESGAANATQTSKPKRKSGRSGGPRKTPRLCDVIKQSNEQIKQLQETMQSNSITSETRSKEREEDQEFFRQMMRMMSQTMMRVTQMLLQRAPSGYHSPNQAYTPPYYSFSSSGMGYGFCSPPARSSSSVTSETLSEDNDL